MTRSFLLSASLTAVFITATYAATLHILPAIPAALPNPLTADASPPLPRTITVCPTDIEPFSIICIPSENPTEAPIWAKFFVNRLRVRHENKAPYAIKGDTSRGARAWTEYPEVAFVKCKLSNRELAKSTITFRCPGQSAAPSPSPMSAASVSPQMSRSAQTSSTPSSTPLPPSASPSSSPTPLPPSASPSPVALACVYIPAQSYDQIVGPGAQNWVPEGTGLTFRPMNMSTRVDPKEFATIEYSFVAPAAGTYAFTLDMETRDNVDHNDVYAQFVQGGWHLERFDAERDRTGLIKVYHNDEGRVIKAFSVDKNRHSISTKRELVQGDTYNIRIGGRSTMTTLHAIVMFPCQGRGCRLGDFWNGRVSECAP